MGNMTISQQQLARRLDRLFSFMPGMFRDKPNFTALMGAIAESDCDLENLFIEIRKQLFVETASESFLDKLGSNVGVPRPALVGMVDEDYREFIKLQTYYPKQIKGLLYRLMELFYGVDTIKANIRNVTPGPYVIFDGATLIVRIDGVNEYTITFSTSSFNDPTAVTAQELSAQINAQVPDTMFATTYFNAADRQEFLEIYTNTFGPNGMVEILGGSANRFLKFPDTLRFGTSILTKYRLVKSSTMMNLYWAGGENPLFSQASVGDYVILTGTPFESENVGSFVLEAVTDTGIPAEILPTTSALYQSANTIRYAIASTGNIIEGNYVTVAGFHNASNNGTFLVLNVSAAYVDLQTTRTTSTDDETHAGTVDLLPSATNVFFSSLDGTSQSEFSVTTVNDVLFFRINKKKLESSKRPATVWEVNSNEIVVTLPASPVVVRRFLQGSAHLQSASGVISSAFSGKLTIANYAFLPTIMGNFYIQKPNGNILRDTLYSYISMEGDDLLGVTPTIVPVGDKLILGAGALSVQNGQSWVKVTTTEPHNLADGEFLNFKNFNAFGGLTAVNINGVRSVIDTIDDLSFKVNCAAAATSTTTNTPSIDKGEIFTAKNSKIVITNLQDSTGYVSSYIFDPLNAPYTISETQTTIDQDILLGEFGGAVALYNSGVFPDTFGEVVINYGREDEEGPIKYIAKSSTGVYIDPSYRFLKSHSSGAAVNLLRYKFAAEMSGTGKEYPVYVVDTITPRDKLEELLLEAKAAGVSMRFIVVLPENVYNAFPLYEL